jgi:hypothetical protein
VGVGTRLWKPWLTERFDLSHRRPAPIDLRRDYAAESADLGLLDLAHARLARKIELWKLRAYWAAFVTHPR